MAESQLLNDDRYLRYIFFGLVYLGVAIVLFVPKSSYFGYTIITAGLSMIILVFYEYIIRDTRSKLNDTNFKSSPVSSFSKLWTFLKYLIVDGTPIFMVFGIVVYLLVITLTYNANIVSGDITPQYTNFRNISAIFLIIEAVMLNAYLKEKRSSLKNYSPVKGNDTTKPDSITGRAMQVMAENMGLIIVLFGTIHILVVIIIEMNLKYFTTEGMKNSTGKLKKKTQEKKTLEKKNKRKKTLEKKTQEKKGLREKNIN